MRWGASNFITTTIISYHITIIKRRSKCKEKCEEAIWRKFCASAAASLCVLWSHLGVLKGSECNVLLTEKVSKSWLRAPSIIPLLGICTLSLSLSLSLSLRAAKNIPSHSILTHDATKSVSTEITQAKEVLTKLTFAKIFHSHTTTTRGATKPLSHIWVGTLGHWSWEKSCEFEYQCPKLDVSHLFLPKMIFVWKDG